jgi:outer membrane protein TolC
MGLRLQQVVPWCGAIAVTLGGTGAATGAGLATNGYTFRGVQAPQVKPNPLAGELNQQLGMLRERLKARSIQTTLSSAIEQSLLHNPELAQAYSQIQQSDWTLIAVRRQWYPTVNATSIGPSGGLWGYGGSSTRTSNTTTAGRVDQHTYQNQDQLAARISLSWTFFDPSRGPLINAASENLRSQQLLFNVAARDLVLQTQLAYFRLQEQQQLIDAYEEILAATTDQVKQVEAAFNIGNASIADVEQIRTQQYQTLSLLIKSYLSLIDAASALATAMALQPGQLVLPADRLQSYGQWDLSLNASIQQAQDLREEIQASLAQANSANWRASALFNRYWPRFALAANGSYSDFNSRSGAVGSTNPDLRQASSWDGAVGVGFNWSIFDGGIAAAEAMASKALSRQYADQAAVQRLQITQDVERSYASYDTSRLALLSSREQAASARQAAIAVRERFNVGYADITSVVQTLNQAISAANSYSLSQREYNSAVASLYRATAQWPDNTLALKDERVEQLKSR